MAEKEKRFCHLLCCGINKNSHSGRSSRLGTGNMDDVRLCFEQNFQNLKKRKYFFPKIYVSLETFYFQIRQIGGYYFFRHYSFPSACYDRLKRVFWQIGRHVKNIFLRSAPDGFGDDK